MHATSIVMNTEASSLMLLDAATGELNVSIPTGPVQEDIVGINIPKDKGVGGWVLRNNTPYISNDITKSDLFWKDLSINFTTRNILCVPLRDEQNQPIGVLQAINRKGGGQFVDEDVFVFETLADHVSIAIERARRYDKLMYKLDEKNIQLSELHHRLKNNLATISALIELEMENSGRDHPEEVLKATNSRIKSVANVHSILYDAENSGKINLKDYIQSILENVMTIYRAKQKDINLIHQIDEVSLDANRAMLCGLIVNELAINSFKHAFLNRRKGVVKVTVRFLEGEKILVEVYDDGIGMANEEKGPNMLYIVHALSRKLKADVSKDSQPGNGSTFRILFSI